MAAIISSIETLDLLRGVVMIIMSLDHFKNHMLYRASNRDTWWLSYLEKMKNGEAENRSE